MIIVFLGTIYALHKSIKEIWWAWNWDEVPMLAFMTLFFTLIGFFISLAISVVIGLFIPKYYSLTEVHDLVALRNKSSVEGDFFLGSGVISENPTYFVLQKENGGTMLKKIDADNAYIYEQKESKPHYDVFQWRFNNDIFMWIASPCCSAQYKIYIPEKSIISNYKVEL